MTFKLWQFALMHGIKTAYCGGGTTLKNSAEKGTGCNATVVLGRENDDYSRRVTDLASKLAEISATASEMAETVTATNKTVNGNTTDIQKLAADMDYLAMQMEVTLDE